MSNKHKYVFDMDAKTLCAFSKTKQHIKPKLITHFKFPEPQAPFIHDITFVVEG